MNHFSYTKNIQYLSDVVKSSSPDRLRGTLSRELFDILFYCCGICSSISGIEHSFNFTGFTAVLEFLSNAEWNNFNCIYKYIGVCVRERERERE